MLKSHKIFEIFIFYLLIFWLIYGFETYFFFNLFSISKKKRVSEEIVSLNLVTLFNQD